MNKIHLIFGSFNFGLVGQQLL